MSRMNSDGSAGAQAKSVSSVYTLLLIVALVAAVGGVIFMASVNNTRFGYSFPMGEKHENAVKARTDFARTMTEAGADIKEQVIGNALKLDVVTETGAP
jgi:hypothetical protein